MKPQPRIREGLSSSDQSQDVEFTIDQQVERGQRKREVNPLPDPEADKEDGTPAGPESQPGSAAPQPARQ